ncbi:MAG: xanthine dehydrogenase family protein molybdopterin-binding subunit [Acidimicrobiaceae bacterium]|nr:xanthine dehydrogenase family protein molybdopterin-binding subunit [Acidimicrobiaceae bacterium]MYJ83778.1 xanthine dehydrogenase family protein molybdopterin-binding subunit [Acidimicrobiaceae bacterium]
MTVTEPKPSYKYVGTRPVRHDGLEKVTGRARFAADLNMSGQLHGIVVRSPHAHARIVSIDTSEAEAMAGVKAVITGDDFPAVDPSHRQYDMCINVIARDKVLYEGHAVAAVAASTRDQAQAAAAAVKVEYEVLPAVLTIDQAMAPGAPLLHAHMMTAGANPPAEEPSNISNVTRFSGGELDAGLAEADLVIEREFTTQPVHQGYIEPHACVADTGQDGHTTIWCSSQGHFNVRSSTATLLGWENTRIRVIPAEIGGGFGGKTTIYLEPLAVALSAKAGRPVKMVMTRDEVFRATGPAPGTKLRIKLGVKRDGTLVAGDAYLIYTNGAYAGPGGLLGAMTVFESYKIPNFEIEALDVVINTARSAAYRAPAAPLTAYAMETMLDEIAEELGIDPIDFRIQNAVTEGDPSTMGFPFARIGFVECLEAVRDHPNYKAPLGPNQGRGIAAGYWFNIGESSSATVNLNEDGTATVVTGSPDIGGSRASMALMAAEELGIDVYDIRPVVGDTEAVGFTDVTEGSRATFATGMAVVEACRRMVVELRGRAAKMMGVEVDDIDWVDGQAVYTGSDGDKAPLSVAEITAKAKRTGGPLTATGSLEAHGAGPGFAVHVCDLEVDPETGVVRVVRYTASQDAGTAIHPSYVEGQIQGGVAQGVGWALNEEYIYDSDGVMENPSFLDYRVPVASDLPMIDAIIVEVPNPAHPYGVRGVGETGIVPPIPAVANAIYGATGCRIRDLPMSPIRVLDAITSNGGSNGA